VQLQFLGAAETVTGSKFLITTGNSRLLVDCGLFQGVKNLRRRNWQPLPFNSSDLDAVVLTHAHLDHSGYVPALVDHGYRGKVFCSAATCALCEILLPDSGYLQEEDARFADKHRTSRHEKALPLYTEREARAALERLQPLTIGEWHQVTSDLRIRLTPVGHILGACCVEVTDGHVTVLFSGDLGRQKDPVMYPPGTVSEADYVVVESTYGNRHHAPSDVRQLMEDVVNTTVRRGGAVLIPAFAIGRAQLALHILQELKASGRIGDVPVFLNSPMAITATELYCRFHDLHRLSGEQCEAIDNNTHYVRSVADSKALVARHFPSVIISASGMATGGRVLHHLKAMLEDDRNTVLFIGFQAPGTRGAALVAGTDRVKIHGAYYPVRAEVRSFDALSAHADCEELVAWLSHVQPPPKHCFVVHGEAAAADSLRLKIKDELGWSVSVPEHGEKAELTADDR
jgi:metallo-beta-lactamase family protein